jgi:membrane protein DedA with SNARE-associated domain
MTQFVTDHGLPLLFAVVMIESFGIPLPGETALIAFSVLASEGHYSIASVIAVAAAGAIVGDNLGYCLIGRVGGRALFRRWGWLHQYSDRVLPPAGSIRARHGGAAVVLGASSRSFATPSPGSPACRACIGRGSCSGMRPAASSGHGRYDRLLRRSV